MAVAAALVIWGGGRVSAGTVQPDLSSLALLPAQSIAIFGVDADGLRLTPMYTRWNQQQSQQPRDKHYDEFVAATGFDPLRDVEAVTGAGWKEGDQGRGLVVVTARYNRAAVAAFLKQQKDVATEVYQGVELFGSNEQPAGKNHGAVALLDDRTIIAGDSAAVRQAIDRRGNPTQSVLANQSLMSRVNQIGAENQIWAVTGAPGNLMNTPLPAPVPNLPVAGQANIARILSGLQASTFGLSAAADMRMRAEAACASEDDARALAEAGRGLLAIARLMAPRQQPQALQVLNSFQIEQYGNQVKVTAQIPAAVLDQLAQHPQALLQKKEHPRLRAED